MGENSTIEARELSPEAKAALGGIPYIVPSSQKASPAAKPEPLRLTDRDTHVEVDRLRSLVVMLCKALRECADDLEAEVRARYEIEGGRVPGALERRFNRDMQPVNDARTAIYTAEQH